MSVLTVVSSFFEKLVFNQLYRYLNDIVSSIQTRLDFRELHSTVTCLFRNTDDWYNGMDTGNLAGMVFGFEKTFDNIDHQIFVGSCNLMAFCIGN